MTEPNFDWPVELSFRQREGRKLAYRYHQGSDLTVVYLGGFHSNMNGEKAYAVFSYSVEKGYSALCLDYSGHGSSEGDFAEGNISAWLADVVHIIRETFDGPFIICGSSMGAWISLLTSLQFPQRVRGILTIAAATDMTERFIWQKCDEEHKRLLQENGRFEWQSPYDDDPYIITQQLVEDGRQHLLLDKEMIELNCPVRMLHGTEDSDISWQNSLDTMNKLTSADVNLKLIKSAGHRLSEPEHIKDILTFLQELLKIAL